MEFLMDVDVTGPTSRSPNTPSDGDSDLLPPEHFAPHYPIGDSQIRLATSLGLEVMALNAIRPPPQLPIHSYSNLAPSKQLSSAAVPRYTVDQTQLSSLHMPDPMILDEFSSLHQAPLAIASLVPPQQLVATNVPASFTNLPLYSTGDVAAIPALDMSMSTGGSAATMPQLPPITQPQDEISVPNQPKPRHLRPSREDWIKYKPEIRRLYLEEKNTLSEVMDIMKEKHDFHATIKMYKSRFGEWGYVKNNKESDIRAMVKIKKRCEAMGKQPEFSVSGRRYDSRRLETYLRRKKKNEQSILRLHTTQDELVASYITYRMNSMGPSVLHPPDVYRLLDALLTAGCAYMDYSFSPDKLSQHEKDTMNYRLKARDDAFLCRHLLFDEDFEQGGRLLRRIALHIEEMLQTQNPFLHMEILVIVSLLGDWPESVTILIRGAARLSQEYIEYPQHPIRVFLTQLASCNEAELVSMATNTTACYIDALARVFGDGSLMTATWVTYLQFGSGYEAMKTRLLHAAQANLQKSEDKLGRCHEVTLGYLSRIAWLEYDIAVASNTGFGTALRRFEQLLKRSEEIPDESEGWWWRYAAENELAAVHQFGLRDFDTSERYWRAAISTLLGNEADAEIIAEEFLNLRYLLQVQGKHEEANEIDKLVKGIFPQDDEEVELLTMVSAINITD